MSTTKKNEGAAAKKSSEGATGMDMSRQFLLARVAGDVAAGVIMAPSESTTSAAGIATVAVEVAEAILKKIGL